MRRLRLTPQSEQVVADWGASASGFYRERMAQLIETLVDGSWEGRWWSQPYGADPDVVEIRPDTHLHVFMNVVRDDADVAGEWADIFTIFASD